MDRQRVKGETAQPVAVLALMDQIGPTKTSKRLGVSTTTLYKARKTKTVSRVYEVAAEAELAKELPRFLEPPEAVAPKHNGHYVAPKVAAQVDTSIFIGEIPRDKVGLLKRVVTAIGATLEVEP